MRIRGLDPGVVSSNPFFSEFAKQVQNVAFDRGFAVLVGNSEMDPIQEEAQLDSLFQRELDGLIVFGVRDTATLDRLVDSGLPLVSMDWQMHSGAVPTVVGDDYGGAKAALDHLVEHGHSNIAFLGGPSDREVAQFRRQAWIDVVGELVGKKRLRELEIHSDFSRRAGYEAFSRWLGAQKASATGLFAASDVQALGALRAAREAGLRVPDDLALVSFDGTQEGEYSNPQLTAVRLPLDVMAAQAIEKLLDGVETIGLHSTIPARLVIRESCGCPRAVSGRR